MTGKSKTGTVFFLWLACMPLMGGTGRPSDGFLSFILLFGFLVVLLGVLQLLTCVKRKIREFLEGIF
jgi:hypothetical protein